MTFFNLLHELVFLFNKLAHAKLLLEELLFEIKRFLQSLLKELCSDFKLVNDRLSKLKLIDAVDEILF